MIRECFKAKTGIIFKYDKLTQFGLHPGTMLPNRLDDSEELPDESRKRIVDQCIERIGDERQSKLVTARKALTDFFIAPLGLLSVPLIILSSVILRPVWYLVRYSPPGRKVRDLLQPLLSGVEPRDNVGDIPDPSVINEDEEELKDALSPIHDQLSSRLVWWIFEIIPLRRKIQKGTRDDFIVRINFGKSRKISGDVLSSNATVYYHHTVRIRETELGYVPNARWGKDRPMIVYVNELGGACN